MPIAVGDLAELESVLGHEFRDPRWLLQALTHSSRIPERTADDSPGDNEKLEFLGDAVLELLVSEELVRTFPDWREGQLSKSRAHLVNASSLCAVARRLGLGKHLRLSRGEEKQADDRSPRSWLTLTKPSWRPFILMPVWTLPGASCGSRSWRAHSPPRRMLWAARPQVRAPGTAPSTRLGAV